MSLGNFLIQLSFLNWLASAIVVAKFMSELTMGQWVMGHGSNGSHILDGSDGSWVTVQ